MNSKHSYVTLNDGPLIPALGFGTYTPEEVPKSKVLEATMLAIDAGFCHIDTAYIYQVEEEVGQAIRNKIEEGTVKRQNIFCTSQQGDDLFPTDEHGKPILDTVDFCATWEVFEDVMLEQWMNALMENYREKRRDAELKAIGIDIFVFLCS
ncbi:PREDICTED: aldo-keto reductase family 1 member C23-like protein [Dipodomys ordii]|uniref:Aldo-keto reductase family 1 member C23-like protein n=1 Tax=Dipodomys ordii TaxID=10020 RepID=A0A1S3EL39_DIPOR|nr:PREDICTED: aldo-keto reductase family 1 member C23-like protein [Dipodomys ordii]